MFGHKTNQHTQVFGHKLTDLATTFGHKHKKGKTHNQPHKQHEVIGTHVIKHETGGAFDIKHKHPDNTHSTTKQNSTHYSSDLEITKRKPKENEGHNFM
jgi:hypothetical protein